MNALELVLGTWEPLNLVFFFFVLLCTTLCFTTLLQFKLEGKITNFQWWPNMGRISKVLDEFWG